MNPTVTIRTATRKDAEMLRSLGILTFRETFEAFNTPEDMELYLREAFSAEQAIREFDEPGVQFFVAWEGEDPVGYAKVRAGKGPKNSLELQRLYVKALYIGQGIGNKLMQTCLQHAQQEGYDAVWLGVWEHNNRAIRFYERWGFEKFGQHIFMLGNDAQTDLLMKKQLCNL